MFYNYTRSVRIYNTINIVLSCFFLFTRKIMRVEVRVGEKYTPLQSASVSLSARARLSLADHILLLSNVSSTKTCAYLGH